jgi:hypothetical protein
MVLGFDRAKRPTRAEVKARQKALSKLFHPDLGGSTDAQRRVNVAVKRILEEIG